NRRREQEGSNNQKEIEHEQRSNTFTFTCTKYSNATAIFIIDFPTSSQVSIRGNYFESS
ncbi:unnamed protein product, partial [Candidula unifasciata]